MDNSFEFMADVRHNKIRQNKNNNLNEMPIHSRLENKFFWYKKWHQKRYANLVHYGVFGVFVIYDIYLLFYFNQVVESIIIGFQ